MKLDSNLKFLGFAGEFGYKEKPIKEGGW